MNNRSAPRQPNTEEVQDFYDYLSANAHGRDNAITAREITEALDLGPDGPRKCRALIHSATEASLLVCSGNDGYFIPLSQDEARETVGRLYSEGTEILDRARTIESLIATIFGDGEAEQMSFLGLGSKNQVT